MHLVSPVFCNPETFLHTTPSSADALYPNVAPLSLFEISSPNTPETLPPLFVSVLLHGNETTGWHAIRILLESYVQTGRALPRHIILLFGNTLASSEKLRHLPEQPDFNRIWPGTRLQDSLETRLAQQVFQYVVQRKPSLHLDIHNNSGRNPFYCVIGKTDKLTLALTQLFSNNALYFPTPRGDATNAFAHYADIPSITMECGQAGFPEHAQAAAQTIEKALAIHSHSELGLHLQADTLTLFETIACIRLKSQLRFTFDFSLDHPPHRSNQTSTSPHIHFRQDLDALNFQPCPAGTILGGVQLTPSFSPSSFISDSFQAYDPQHQLLTTPILTIENNQLITACDFTPAMLTCDIRIAASDCLGYALQAFNPKM